MSNLDLSYLFRGPYFTSLSILHNKGLRLRLNSLVDTGAQGYLFLNSKIATSVSTALQQPIRKLPY
jgi:predicted aspartyl protease